MAVCRLYVLRHGETEWNVEQRLQGHTDSGLTQWGRRQVELLGKRLGALPFAALYCSDLPRALDSIRPLASKTGLEPRLERRLRERNLGVFEGLNARECTEQHGEAWSRFKSNDPEFVVPGGESGRELSQRTHQALREIAGRHLGQTVAVMGHGGTLNHTFRLCLSLPLTARRNFSSPNASVNIIDYDDCAGFFLHAWGDVSHWSGMDG
jgi:probable phosphoglycerate mutase